MLKIQQKVQFTIYNLQFRHLADALNPERLTVAYKQQTRNAQAKANTRG